MSLGSGRLDYLIDEMCQITTWVDCITRRQACLGGFAPSPYPSLEALFDEDDDASDDKDDDASSSSDDEMTTSQWLGLCHSWKKGGVVLDWE